MLKGIQKFSWLFILLAVQCSSNGDIADPVSNSLEVEFILGYADQEWSGAVRDTIEKLNGKMIIDYEQSVVNEYWIARGEKSGVFIKISEPEYKIVDAWIP